MFNTDPKQAIDKDKIVNIQEQKQTIKFHDIRPHKGHTLFEVDIDNETVRKVDLSDKTAVMSETLPGQHKAVSKVETKPNCLYISCLNKKNLIRLIIQAGGQDITHYTFE